MAQIDRWEIAVDLELSDLRTKLAQARTQLASTEQQLQRMAHTGARTGKQLADGWTPFERNIVTLAGKVFLLKTAFEAIRAPVEGFYRKAITASTHYAASIVNQSEQIGASTKTIQAMSAGLQGMSGSAGTAHTVFRMLARTISSAAGGGGLRLPPKEAFKTLGVSVKESADTLKPVSKVIDELSKSFNKLADGPRKFQLATSIFGYAAGDMLSLFSSLKESHTTYIAEAERLGLIIPDALIKPTKELGVAMNFSRAQSERLFQLFGAQAAPAITPMVKALQDAKAALLHWMMDQDEVVTGFTSGIMEKFTTAFEFVKQRIEELPDLQLGTMPHALGSGIGFAGATAMNTFTVIIGFAIVSIAKIIEVFERLKHASDILIENFKNAFDEGWVFDLIKDAIYSAFGGGSSAQVKGKQGGWYEKAPRETESQYEARFQLSEYWAGLETKQVPSLRMPGGPEPLQTVGKASWYGNETANRPMKPGEAFAPENKTASGESYDPRGLTAAHRTLPMGSIVRVTNIANGKSVDVRVNDRGPGIKNRIIDLSKAAAEQLGMVGEGLTEVRIQPMAPTVPQWMKEGKGAPPGPAGMSQREYERHTREIEKRFKEEAPPTPQEAEYKSKLTAYQITKAKIDAENSKRMMAAVTSGKAAQPQLPVPSEPEVPAGVELKKSIKIREELGFVVSKETEAYTVLGTAIQYAGFQQQAALNDAKLANDVHAQTVSRVNEVYDAWSKLTDKQKETSRSLQDLKPILEKLPLDQYKNVGVEARAAFESRGIVPDRGAVTELKEKGTKIGETPADRAYQKKIDNIKIEREALIRGSKAMLEMKEASTELADIQDGLRKGFTAATLEIEKQKRSVELYKSAVSSMAQLVTPEAEPARRAGLEGALERAKAAGDEQEQLRITEEMRQMFQRDDIARARTIAKQRVQIAIDLAKHEISLENSVRSNFRRSQELAVELHGIETQEILDDEKRKLSEMASLRSQLVDGNQETQDKILTQLEAAHSIQTKLSTTSRDEYIASKRVAYEEAVKYFDKELESYRQHIMDMAKVRQEELDARLKAERENFEEQQKTILNLKDAMLKGIDDMFSGVILGTQKLSDIWKGLWVSLVKQTVHGFGEVIAKKLDFEGKLNLNFYQLGKDISKKWTEIFGPGGTGIGGIVKKGLAAVFGDKEAAEKELLEGGMTSAEGGGLMSAMGEVPVTAAEGLESGGMSAAEGGGFMSAMGAVPVTAQAAKAAISVAGAGAGAGAVPGAATAAQGGMSTMLGGAETVGQASSVLGTAAAPEAGGAIAGVGQAGQAAAGMGGGGACCQEIGELATKFKEALKDAMGSVKDALTGIWDKAKGSFKEVGGWLKDGFGAVGDKFKDLGGLITKAWDKASKFITEDLGEALKSLGGLLGDGLSAAGDLLGDIGGALADGFSQMFSYLIGILANVARQIFASGGYIRGSGTAVHAARGMFLTGSPRGIPIIAHPFEGILNSHATARAGGEHGIMMLNKGLIPPYIVARVLEGEGSTRRAADGIYVAGGVPIPRVGGTGGVGVTGGDGPALGNRSISIGEGAINIHTPPGIPFDGMKMGADLMEGILHRWNR